MYTDDKRDGLMKGNFSRNRKKEQEGLWILLPFVNCGMLLKFCRINTMDFYASHLFAVVLLDDS